MKALLNWFDERTGYKQFVHEALYERIPGGDRWRYVWGSTLVFAFSMQMITGLFLWMAYSPSAQTAWESVYHIQYEMQYGWLLRGLHHFTAQAMIVLLALHLMQVVIDGAYKAPREVNFWLGLILLKIVLGLSLTGYLLPWDQKGYWATQVATKIMGITPVVGPQLQKIVVGGSNYGHHTLTRFFALHAGLLPALLIGFLALHIYVFRRHGITVPNPIHKPDATFWPDQVLKDGVACLAVLAVVLFLIFRPWLSGSYELAGKHDQKPKPFDVAAFKTLSEQGRLGEVVGAELGAPADPSEPYSAARPEWYFLFLFQFLKYFPGETEIYGAMVIPGALMSVLFLMPFIGRWKLGHRFNVAYLFIVLAGIGVLTYLALSEDKKNEGYKLAVEDAEIRSKRIVELIQESGGVDVSGARVLLKNDPKIQGPKVFAKYCAPCHRYNGSDGTGAEMTAIATASDLGDFGSREWIRGYITSPGDDKHFGATANGSFNGVPNEKKFADGAMVKWVAENGPKMKKEEVDAVVELLFSQGSRNDLPKANPDLVKKGQEFFDSGSATIENSCLSCHELKVDGQNLGSAGLAPAPELSGYTSDAWLRDFLVDPGAPRHYGKRNAMPAFKDKMSDKEVDILVRWMLHGWHEPAGEPGT